MSDQRASKLKEAKRILQQYQRRKPAGGPGGGGGFVHDPMCSPFVPVKAKEEADTAQSAEATDVHRLNNCLLEERAYREQLASQYAHLYDKFSQLYAAYSAVTAGGQAPANSDNFSTILSVLVDEKAGLQSQLRQAMEMANEQSSERAKLEQRMAEVLSRNGHLEAEAVRLQEEADGLRRTLKASDEKAQTLDRELREAGRLLDESLEDGKEMRAKLKAQEACMCRLSETVEALKRDIEKKNYALMQFSGAPPDRGAVVTEPAAFDELQKRMDAMNEEMAMVKEESARWQNEASYLRSFHESSSRHVAAKMAELEAQCAQLLQDKSKLEAEVQLLALSPPAPAKDVTESTEDADTEQRTLDDGVGLSQELEERIRSQEEQIAALMNDIEVKEAEVQSLNEKLVERAQQASDYQLVLEQLHNEKTASCRALSQNKALKQQLEELEEKFVSMSMANADLASRLQSKQPVNPLVDHAEVDRVEESCVSAELLSDSMYAKSFQPLQRLVVCPAATAQAEAKEQGVQCAFLNGFTEESTNSCDTEILLEPVEQITNLLQENEALRLKLNSVQGRDVCKVDAEAAAGDQDVTEDAESASALKNLRQFTELLQERFVKAMNENADLQDENQRLEHLIVQLQSETDTIGEFITLYQHQRNVVRQRLREKEEYTAHVCREREIMKENIMEMRDLISKLLFETGCLKTYPVCAVENGGVPSAGSRTSGHTPVVNIASVDETSKHGLPNDGGTECAAKEEEPLANGLPETDESGVQDVYATDSVYALAERINSLLRELLQPELANQLPPRGLQLQCRHCIGRLLTL